MKITIMAFAFALAVPAGVRAQNPCTQIDDYIAPLQKLQVFSGAVLVVRGDTTLCERALGMASIELGVAMRADNIFRVASISKSFTKALFGILAERGRLRLNDSIARWLPAFPSASAITIQMLLDHRAGVPNMNSLKYDEEALLPNTLAALVDTLATRSVAPSSLRRYSNGGFAVLARIIELNEKTSYAEVLQREILEPLGLAHTAHEQDGAVIPRMAVGYQPAADSFGVMRRAPFQEMATKTGGGSLVSDARDMARWMKSIGRASIMSSAMWHTLFPTADSLIEFSGRNPGFNSYVGRDTRADVTVVVLTNNYAASMAVDVGAAALQIAQGRRPAPLLVRAPEVAAQAYLDSLAGNYAVPGGVIPIPPGVPLELRRVGQNLVAFAKATALDVLIPQGGRKFLARNAYMMLEFDESRAGLKIKPLYRDGAFEARRIW